MCKKIRRIIGLSVLSIVFFANYSHSLELSGRIVNISTSKGQQNIKVTVIPASGSQGEIGAVTDAAGIFSVPGLENGSRYIVKAATAGSYAVFPKFREIQTLKSDIQNCDFIYCPKYSVSGFIDSGALKSSGLKIMFKSEAPFYDNAVAYTGENGRYKVDGLIYGQEYRAYISSGFNVYGVVGDNSLTVSKSNIKNMKILPVFYGTGKVLNADTKHGLADVVVKAVSFGGAHEISSVSSSDGSFILTGLYYGESYVISADSQPGFEIPAAMKTGTVKSTVTGLDFLFISK